MSPSSTQPGLLACAMPSNLSLRFTICRVGEAPPADYDSETTLDSPQAIETFWRTVIAARSDHERDKEHLVAILLNAKLRPLGYHVVAVGSLNECIAHPREIMRPAIVAAAYSFVLSHNHPSGDPTPSLADQRLTRKLHAAAELLEIHLLDHVIIGDAVAGNSAYYSFKESGVL